MENARCGLRSQGNLARTPDMAVVTPFNNPGGPEGDTVTVDEQLLNTEYCKGRAQGKEALSHTNRHTGRASTVL